MDNLWIPFLFTLIAGLSTGLGSLLAYFTKRTNTSFLCISLGFSAGVMIYISFVEMLPNAGDILQNVHGNKIGSWLTAAAFFGGIFLIALIDKLVPSYENPHEVKKIEEMNKTGSKKLMRMGVITAIVIAIHNFPEGIATFITTSFDKEMGFAIMIAIAIHNIPEGISVSIPVYFATGNRKKAFWYSMLSGFSEPIGALLCWICLMPFIENTPDLLGFVFGAVSGIMVYISLDELLPTAEQFGKHHQAIWGVIAGMIVMALTILLI